MYYTCTIFLSTQEWFNVWNILYYPVFKNIFKRKKNPHTKSIDQCQHRFSVCASVRERVYAYVCNCTGLIAFASCFVSSLYEVVNYLFLAEIPVHTGTDCWLHDLHWNLEFCCLWLGLSPLFLWLSCGFCHSHTFTLLQLLRFAVGGNVPIDFCRWKTCHALMIRSWIQCWLGFFL